MLADNGPGNYRYLASPDRPFSSGVIANSGYDLVHAKFDRLLPLDEGLNSAKRHVEEAGRRVTAIAGFELRLPKPLARKDFDSFNEGYVKSLSALGLAIDGQLPATRTNVAAILDAPNEPSLYGFLYTVPSKVDRRAFVLSGAPEQSGTSPGAMLDSIVSALSERLGKLGASWADATTIQLYCVANVQQEVMESVLEQVGRASIHGIRWFPSYPPIEGLNFEIDARSVSAEVLVSA